MPAVEAIHLGSLIAAQGYIFPISDHVLTMKDDGTFYRFQVGLLAPVAEGPCSCSLVILTPDANFLKQPQMYLRGNTLLGQVWENHRNC